MKYPALICVLVAAFGMYACGDADTSSNPESDVESSASGADAAEDDEGNAGSDQPDNADEEDTGSAMGDSSSSDDDAEEEEWQGDDVNEDDASSLPVEVQWPNVVINEVAPSGSPADWVELLNRSDEVVELSGWTMTDDDPEHIHAFEDGQVLAPGAYLLLLKEDAGGFTFGLGDADSVSLYAPDGSVVDTTSWEDGAAPDTTSWGRIPNGQGEFMTLEVPTPGGSNAPNDPQECGNDNIELGEVCDGESLDGRTCEDFDYAQGQLLCQPTCDDFDTSACIPPNRDVVINEVSSSDDDRIELFNPGLEPVVMTGWTMSDENDIPSAGIYTFPAGSVLAAGAYLVLQRDVDHLFGLGGNDAVKLRDQDGILVDIMDWPKDGAERGVHDSQQLESHDEGGDD